MCGHLTHLLNTIEMIKMSTASRFQNIPKSPFSCKLLLMKDPLLLL